MTGRATQTGARGEIVWATRKEPEDESKEIYDRTEHPRLAQRRVSGLGVKQAGRCVLATGRADERTGIAVVGGDQMKNRVTSAVRQVLALGLQQRTELVRIALRKMPVAVAPCLGVWMIVSRRIHGVLPAFGGLAVVMQRSSASALATWASASHPASRHTGSRCSRLQPPLLRSGDAPSNLFLRRSRCCCARLLRFSAGAASC